MQLSNQYEVTVTEVTAVVVLLAVTVAVVTAVVALSAVAAAVAATLAVTVGETAVVAMTKAVAELGRSNQSCKIAKRELIY